jgi:hypothetical protein
LVPLERRRVMDAWQWWALAGLVLGLVGALANDQSVVRITVNDWGGGRLDLSDEGVKRRVLFSRWGWRLIALATVCGIIATFAQ